MEKTINENELENVNGGLHNYPASGGHKVEVDGVEYDVVNFNWGCPCRDFGHNPTSKDSLPIVPLCVHCKDFRYLSDIGKKEINGWNGYCVWR